MESNVLHHTPAFRFLKSLTVFQKAVLLLLAGALLAATVLFLMAAEEPSRWSVSYTELSDTEPHTLTLKTFHRDFRDVSMGFYAWDHYVKYITGMMLPAAWTVLVFMALQALFWSALITVITYLRGWWGYVFISFFALAFYLAGPGEIILKDNPGVVSGGLVMLVILPVFLFQQELLRVGFALRFIVFLALISGIFLLMYQSGGALGLHRAATGLFLPMFIFSILFLFFSGSELTSALVLFSTNAKNPKRRLPLYMIATLWMLLLAVELLMLQNMGPKWIPLEGFPLRPAHLIAAASLLILLTRQNLSPLLGGTLPSSAFTIALPAIAGLNMSCLFYYTATGEHLYIYMVERGGLIVITLLTLLHFVWILMNFHDLIQRKLPAFFLMGKARRMLYMFVIGSLAIGVMALDSVLPNRTLPMMLSTMYSQLADHQLLANEKAEAQTLYREAALVAKGSIKGNYNLAMLIGPVGGNEKSAREYFEAATRFYPFDAAAIYKAYIDCSVMDSSMAKSILQEVWQRRPTPATACNLAHLWFSEGEPDTAIAILKKGLELFPDEGALYANLAWIYFRAEQPEWMHKFLVAGFDAKNPSPALVTNSLLYNITWGDSIQVPENRLKDPAINNEEASLFNLVLYNYRRGNKEACRATVDTLISKFKTPDTELLEGVVLFESDSIDLAVSRFLYLAGNEPKLSAIANHYLGAMYFVKGVPEMAAEYFRRAVAAGDSSEMLLQAQMEIDAGRHDSALVHLGRAMVTREILWKESNREAAMLIWAGSDGLSEEGLSARDRAMTYWDMADPTHDERIRLGIYAGQRQNYVTMLDAFRMAQEADSSSPDPFLAMARVLRRNGDTTRTRDVVNDLKYALTKSAGNPALQLELALAQFRLGDAAAAEATLNSIADGADPMLTGVLKAGFALARGDSAAALTQLEQLHATDPLNFEVNIELARLNLALHRYVEGHNSLFHVYSSLNPQNGEYMYYLAHFERNISRPEEAGAFALKAMNYFVDPARKAAIEKEFAEEIALARTGTGNW